MAKYYESDVTCMLRELLQERPQIVEEQRKGRGMWWDRKLDQDALRRSGDSQLQQQAYVYQTKN